MEPSGRNRWQPVANGTRSKPLKQADSQLSATHGNRFGAQDEEGVSSFDKFSLALAFLFSIGVIGSSPRCIRIVHALITLMPNAAASTLPMRRHHRTVNATSDQWPTGTSRSPCEDTSIHSESRKRRSPCGAPGTPRRGDVPMSRTPST
jgi:hypothetical protein